MGTDDNLSEIFTKIVGPNKFESLHDRMMVACSMPTAQELASAGKGFVYKADWELAAPSGRHVLGVSWGVLSLVGTIYTKFNSGFMENPYFEKLAIFPVRMWTCGGLAPCGPSTLLATKKASFRQKTCPLAIPLIMGQNITYFSKNIDF